MTGFQIVTARSFNRLTRTLRAPGIRHQSPLVAMIESIGNREADIYVLTLRNRITGTSRK